MVREKVFQNSGISLEWEIMRVGREDDRQTPAKADNEQTDRNKRVARGTSGHVEQDIPESGGTDGRTLGRARGVAVVRA